MAAVIEKASSSVYTIVDRLISQTPELSHLAAIWAGQDSEHDSGILVVMRETASKSGNKVQLAKTQKAPAVLRAATGIDYQYVIEIAGDEWLNLNVLQQEALMFRQLCYCKLTEDEKSGEVKCSLKKPDVEYFHAELNHYGDWIPRPEEEDVEGAVTGSEDPSILEGILGVTPRNPNTGNPLEGSPNPIRPNQHV